MEFVKPCPSCATQLKFPVDKGTLNVKCPKCGFGFSVNPDDSSLYNQGEFYRTPSLSSRIAVWWDNFKASALRLLNPILRRIPRPAASYESGGNGSLPDSYFFIGLFVIVLLTLLIGRTTCYNSTYSEPRSRSEGYLAPVPKEKDSLQSGEGSEQLQALDEEEKNEPPAFPSNEKFLHEGTPFKGQ